MFGGERARREGGGGSGGRRLGGSLSRVNLMGGNWIGENCFARFPGLPVELWAVLGIGLGKLWSFALARLVGPGIRWFLAVAGTEAGRQAPPVVCFGLDSV